MGRAYAGILGPVAFLTVLAREFLSSAGMSTKLYHAWIALVVFAVLGSIIGHLAGKIVEDSVQAEISAEMAATQAQSAAGKGHA